MKNCIRLAAVIGLFVFASHTSDSVLSGTTVRATERTVNIASEYGKLPLSFEPNRGQFDSRYTFGSQGPGYALLLEPTSATLRLQTTTFTLKLRGTNPRASLRGAEPLPGLANYYRGNKEQWITQVPTFDKVVVNDVYPGIDAVYYGNQQRLEYDFIVKPGATADSIDLDFGSASSISLGPDGDLVISVDNREFRQSRPVVYQMIREHRVPIEGHYRLNGNRRVGFEIGKYDRTQPLIIDPQLIYSFYGPGNSALGIAVDPAGNVYICGSAEQSQEFGEAYVAKFNTTGTALIYANRFGAFNGNDVARAIAVDAAGSAYVTGSTRGSIPEGPFPTINPIQATGFDDAFVTKFDAAGNMVYSTLLGGQSAGDPNIGTGLDIGTGIAVDSLGNIYVTGVTQAIDFPTFKPFQAGFGGGTDAFLTVLNPQGSAFIFSTYIGGSADDHAAGIAVDASGNSYVTGGTSSANFPTTGNSALHGSSDAFVFKMNPAGSALMYSVLLGGSGGDGAQGIALDSSANAYLVGTTNSTDFPVVGAFQSTFGGGFFDAFVSKINSTGTALLYSTYLGGSNNEEGTAIAVNGTTAYVAGDTTSPDFPQVHSLQGFKGLDDAFVAKLSTDGSTLGYSTLLGGAQWHQFGPASTQAHALASDGATNVFVGGATSASDFPTTSNPANVQCCPGTSGLNSQSSFIVKLGDDQTPTTFTRVEQNNPAAVYSGDWLTNSNPNHSGGSAALTLTNSVTFSFSGTGVRWIGFSDPWSGIANVYIDGVFKTSVDTYSSLTKYQVVQYAITGLAAGNHTLRIQATGQHNPNAASAWVWVDAFEFTSGTGATPDFTLTVAPSTATVVQGSGTAYTVSVAAVNGFSGTVSLSATGFGSGASGSFSPSSITGSGSSTLTVTTSNTAQTGAFTITVSGSSGGLAHSVAASLNVSASGGGGTFTRVEQNNAAVQYTGDWLTNSNVNNSGGSAVLSLASSSATFSFSGTAARWIGFSDPWSGIANVYVDGVFKASVDTYSSATRYQVVQYTTTGLASGNHTLMIQTTGQRNPAAASAWIWIDAFEFASSGGTTANPDFSLSVTPLAATVVQGGSTTYSVSVAGLNGSPGNVTLSASGFGSGANGSFNPPIISGSGSSMLTVTANSTAQTGSFTLTITASNGSFTHTKTVTLSVNPSGGAITFTRVEQDNAAVHYTADWLTNTNPNNSGGSATLTLVNSATFSFSGTAVRWIGFSDPWSGLADVFVDGVFKTTVDTYSTTTRYQVIQYTITGLAPGNHTLTISATGRHNSAAASAWVWIDALESGS
jgi:hypothetical protein